MVTPQSIQRHTGLTHHFLKFLTFGLSGAQVLNDLADSFCNSQKNAGLKGLR